MLVPKEEKVSRRVDVFIPVYPVSVVVVHRKRDNVDRKTIINRSNNRSCYQIFISLVLVKIAKNLNDPSEKPPIAISRIARSARESESSWRVHVRTYVRTRVSFLALGVGIGGPRLVSRSPVPPLPNHGDGSTTSARSHGPHALATGCPKKFGPRDAFTSRFSARRPLPDLRDPSISSRKVSRSRKSRAWFSVSRIVNHFLQVIVFVGSIT